MVIGEAVSSAFVCLCPCACLYLCLFLSLSLSLCLSLSLSVLVPVSVIVPVPVPVCPCSCLCHCACPCPCLPLFLSLSVLVPVSVCPCLCLFLSLSLSLCLSLSLSVPAPVSVYPCPFICLSLLLMNIFCMFKEYIPAARETIACTDLPNGKAFYEQVSLGSFELFLTITLHLFICEISYLEHCGLSTMYMYSGKDYANVTCIFCLMELINNRKTKTNKQTNTGN